MGRNIIINTNGSDIKIINIMSKGYYWYRF
jgi:hypothetical protein